MIHYTVLHARHEYTRDNNSGTFDIKGGLRLQLISCDRSERVALKFFIDKNEFEAEVEACQKAAGKPIVKVCDSILMLCPHSLKHLDHS